MITTREDRERIERELPRESYDIHEEHERVFAAHRTERVAAISASFRDENAAALECAYTAGADMAIELMKRIVRGEPTP